MENKGASLVKTKDSNFVKRWDTNTSDYRRHFSSQLHPPFKRGDLCSDIFKYLQFVINRQSLFAFPCFSSSMAASAEPSGNNQEASLNQKAPQPPPSFSTPDCTAVTCAGNSSSAAAETSSALRHDPGISVDWTLEEQSTLEDLLTAYATDSTIAKYAKIAMRLKDKTVRDVALRCRWMSKKENGKRRKEDHSSTKKNKDRREKAIDTSAKPPSSLATHPTALLYGPPIIPVDNDDGILYKAIGGVTGDLLEQNSQLFNQISANFTSYQIHENINLFCKARDNILGIMNEYLMDMPEVMRQMPPLPIKLNEELANSILPSHPIR